MLPRRFPRKRKNTEDSLEKKKKPKDLVGKKKGKQKVPQVKKKNQSSGKRKRDIVTLEKDDGDDGGSSSIPTKRMQRTSKLNREGETETPHSTVAPTENETDLAETERSSTRSPSPKLEEEDDEEVGSTDAGAPQIMEIGEDERDKTTTEISSILGPIEREQQVIYQTMDEECWGDMELLDDGDDHDAIVDGWNKFIVREGGQIFWEDIFMEDTKSRTLEIEQQEVEQLEEEHEAGNKHEDGNEYERIHGGEPVVDLESLKEMVVSLMSQMTTMEGKINNKLEDLDRRLKMLEGDSIGIGNMEFQYYHNEDGGTSGQKDKDDEKDGGNDADKDDGNDAGKDDEKELEKEHEDEEAEEDAEKDGNELEDEEAAKEPEESEDEEAANEHEEIEENEKDDGKEPQKELQEEEHETGNESEKEFEVQPEKEAAAAEKRVSKRVPKLSHLQKSPFVKK
ncbi:hypothetical protein Bca4012_082641 [Brassica carinata]